MISLKSRVQSLLQKDAKTPRYNLTSSNDSPNELPQLRFDNKYLCAKWVTSTHLQRAHLNIAPKLHPPKTEMKNQQRRPETSSRQSGWFQIQRAQLGV